MSGKSVKSWRGYLYVGLGLAFGIYRGVKVAQWGPWDFLDQVLALGMILAGVFVILKKEKSI